MLNNSTSKPHFKQVFNKRPVIECRLRFANGNSILERFSRSSMRGSRWLEGRIRKLASAGASGETILAAYGAGLKVVTRGSAYRRRLSSVLAPKRRQAVAAPVVARSCARESSSEGHDDGGDSDDSGDSDGSGDSDLPAQSPLIGGRSLRNESKSRNDKLSYPIARLTLGCAGLMSCSLLSLARWSR